MTASVNYPAVADRKNEHQQLLILDSDVNEHRSYQLVIDRLGRIVDLDVT